MPGRLILGIDAATALFAPGFEGARGERLQVAYLDAGRRLIELQLHGGGANTIDLPLRRIVAKALELQARELVIAHNHPSGDPAPSDADLRMTRQLDSVVKPLGLKLRDHLIFAGGRWTSFYAAGLL